MTDNNLFAIIVAGGSGLRMARTIPKQFIQLNDLPILMHTVIAFNKIGKINIILALPHEHIETWNKLCLKYNFKVPHKIVEGGKTRGESVFNGLEKLPDEGLVAIHDGVRPFIHENIIRNSFKTAELKGTAVTAVDLKDSIRIITARGSKTIDRTQFKIVQTPQTFQIPLIKAAYKKLNSFSQTDDATVAELAGNEIELIEGSYDNIKITTPEDLAVAQEILKRL